MKHRMQFRGGPLALSLLLAAGCAPEPVAWVPTPADCDLTLSTVSSWPSDVASGDTVRIRYVPGSLGCALRIDSSQVVAFGADEPLATELGTITAVRSDGTMLVNGRATPVHALLSLDPAEHRLAVVGWKGEGPGEFGVGFYPIQGGVNDTTFLVDKRRQWRVVTPDNRLVGERPAGEVGRLPWQTCRLADGRLLIAPRDGSDRRVELLDTAFTTQRTFRHPDFFWPNGSRYKFNVRCGADGGYGIMVADRDRRQGEVRLVFWDPIADRSVEIRVEVPFFDGGELQFTASLDGSETRVAGQVQSLLDLGGGRVLLSLETSDARWHPTSSSYGLLENNPPLRDSLYDLHYVLVDLRHRVIIGHTMLDAVSQEALFYQAARSDRYHRVVETEDSMVVMQYRVVGAAAPPGVVKR